MTEPQRENSCLSMSNAAIAVIASRAEKAGLSMSEIAAASRLPYVNITRMFSGSYRRVITLRGLVALADSVGAKVEITIK